MLDAGLPILSGDRSPRWAIRCGEHFQPLLDLMRDSLLASRVIHCDETQVQVFKEPDREPSSQSWM